MKAKICHTPPAVSVARQLHLSLPILNPRMSTYPAHTAHPRSNTRLREITPSSGPSHGPAGMHRRCAPALQPPLQQALASCLSCEFVFHSQESRDPNGRTNMERTQTRHSARRQAHLSPAGSGALVESLHGVVRECSELGELGELRVELQYARTLCVGIHDDLQIEEQRTRPP